MGKIPLGAIPGHYAALLGEDRVALIHPEGELSWGGLERATNQRARRLAKLGVEADDLVTIALPNGNRFFETTFAIWKLGATPHVVSSRLPAAELQEIIAVAKPRLVIGPDPEILPGTTVLPADFTATSHDDGPMPAKVAHYWKAMSSGGSTGRPKIIVDHNPAVFDPDEEDFLDMPSAGCLLNPGPLYHNAPFIMAHRGLFRGNQVVGMLRFDAAESLRLIEQHCVEWVMMVPTMMHRIWRLDAAEREAFDLSSLRIVSHVAAPMPVWLKQNWIDWLGPERVWELYGGTEGTGVTWCSGTEWLAHKGTVGKTVRGSSVRILDENGKDCPSGVMGEVYLMPEAGPGTSYHYIGAEAKVADGGWETLGDVGYVDEDGYLYLGDRRGDMIISGGANIYPAEVESTLAEHPGVDTVVAIGLPDEDMGELVHAIVQPHDDWNDKLNDTMLAEFVKERLARYKTPRSYEFVTYSLRNDAGKVRRSQLRAERIPTKA